MKVVARAVRLGEKAASAEALAPSLARLELRPGPGECLVEIRAAGVNPSDAKAGLGLMPHAVWPRTPGCDYAGVVVEGPPALVGREVWGTGGDLGIRRDGSHASHLVLPAVAVREKPARLSLEEAAGIGVPFVTAWEGFAAAGGIGQGDVVLVLGANGKVGQAAVQIAAMAGARVFAAARLAGPHPGHATAPVEAIDARSADIAAVVREKTGGHGADIVYNTVGSSYFEAGNKAMAQGARAIFIATIDRAVPFDIFAFYRGRHRYVGVDSLALDAAACALHLDAMRPGFENGALRPFPVASPLPLAEARTAYQRVLEAARERIVLRP
jgi:NADPH:quinone reductase-like Zn-dependent oxidoreductase